MAFEKRGGRDHGITNPPFLGRGVGRCLGIPRRHGSIAAGVLLILLLVFIQACSHGVGAFFSHWIYDTEVQGKDGEFPGGVRAWLGDGRGREGQPNYGST